jgi:hypothetical protein
VFPSEIWLKPGAVHDAIPEKLRLFWNDTAVESAPRFLTVDEKKEYLEVQNA